jgi:SSS family solute:Na+ symporter
VLAFWIGPRIWRLASAHGFYTAGDLLEYRYGASVRGTVASLIWVGTLTILAAQLIAGAGVLAVVAGVSKPTGVIIGAIVMTLYFVAGGLLGSVWVNVVQLVVLLGGFLVAIPLLYGPLGGAAAFSSMPVPHDRYWDFLYSTGAGYSGWAMLAVLTPAFIVSPGLLQKTYGAASERAVRVGISTQAVAQMVFGLFPVFFGLAARAAHLEIEGRDLVLPTVLATQLPPAVGAIGLAAVFSAEVSTCDAILFMLSTSLSKDLYKRFVNPAATDRQVLLVARLAAVAGAIAGAALAIVLATVVDALTIFYSLVGVSLLVPVLGGLVSRRAGAPEALGSIVAGIATLLTVHFSTAGRGFGLLNPNILGLTAAALAYLLVLGARSIGSQPGAPTAGRPASDGAG